MTRRSHPIFAALYDCMNAVAERKVLGAWRRRLLEPLTGTVVEIGAGTGIDFAYYSAGAHVLALEPDPAMLKRARARIEQSAAQIELRTGGDEALDELPPGSVDSVVFFLVLCTIGDPELALRRARRVLRPSGKLLIIEHVRSPGRLGRVQDVLAPLWKRVGAGCHLNRDTAATIARAGFETRDLTTVPLSGPLPIRELIAGEAAPLEDPRG